MYLLSHVLTLLGGPQTDDDVTGPLEDRGRATLGARTEAFDGWSLVDASGSNNQPFRHVLLEGTRKSGAEKLVDEVRSTVHISLGGFDRFIHGKTANKIGHEAGLAGGDPHIAENHSVLSFYFSFDFSHDVTPYLA
jgi:hypothetical protein